MVGQNPYRDFAKSPVKSGERGVELDGQLQVSRVLIGFIEKDRRHCAAVDDQWRTRQVMATRFCND
ncbi:MAG: hypothetical protein EA371_01430 [Gammaproteobacteria bacterium]|nr:MAG: hypothetical protein EA371_01430 [Gammaproteobacteria bacterium]